MSGRYTRRLPELRREDAAEFGGKSANLGDLLAAGIPVPPGFAIGAGAYRAFVEAAGLDGTIAAALSRGPDDAAKAIGEAMRFAPFPNDLRAELVSLYAELGEPPVAVRSSALGEDARDATHAGQQESFLWIRGAVQLCDAVRDCWVSLYTPRAIAYRARLGAKDAAMGVTVQAMVDAAVSGVLFTCNPVSGDPSMVAVNASWGLGLSVVGGETTPDDYLVSKVTGEVVRQTVSSKDVEYVPDSGGHGTVRLEVPDERRAEPCLGGAELAALVDLAKRCERHFGCHQDVEWAIERLDRAGGAPGSRPGAAGLAGGASSLDRAGAASSLGGRLHVLQARPVTAMKEAPRVSASALSLVMDTFGAGERP